MAVIMVLQLIVLPGTAVAAAPGAPANVEAVAVSGNKITVSWASVGSGITYNIYRSQDNGNFTKLTGSPVAGTSYDDTWVSPAVTYYYYVTAVNQQSEESGRSNVASALTPGTDNIVPGTPTGLRYVSLSYRQIELVWNPSADASGIRHYEVWCRPGATGSFSLITQVTATTFTHTGLNPGTVYQYYIVAVDNYGNKSAVSEAQSFQTAADNIRPGAPSGLSAAAVGSTQINLSWNAGTDNVAVAGYNIYRQAGTGSLAKINAVPVTATGYADTGLSPGITYTYQVATVDAAGNDSTDRAQISRTTPVDNQAPSKPDGLVATPSGLTRINLTWNASADNAGVAEYFIYRSTDNRNFAKIAKTTDRTYSDTGLTLNTTYYYKVSARDAAGNESVPSEPASARLAVDSEKPVGPSLWAVAESTSRIKISWSGATDNVGVTGYDLYRAVGSGSYHKIAGPASSPYYDNDVSSNRTYTYYIRAKDAAGNVSDAGNTVTATTNGDTTRPSTPGNFSYTAVSNTEVNLTWEASSDNREVGGYRVYRAYESGSYYLLASTSETHYRDRGLNANREYRYYITAYDTAGNESDGSHGITVYTSSAEKTVERGNSGYVEISGIAALDVPPDALSRETSFKMVTGSFGDYSNSGYKTIGQPVKITARANGSEVTSFNAGLTVTMYYNSSQLGSADVNKLRIYYWDDGNDEWAPLPSTVYWSPQKVTARTSHLTAFALLADTTAPDEPSLNNPSNSTDRIVTLTGAAEAYTEVEININGRIYKTNATGKGRFALEVMLDPGTNSIELRAKDAADNRSSWSDEYRIKCNPYLVLSDISGHWAEYNIQKALELGISDGYKDKTFRPDRTITRAEFCRFVVSALGYSQVNSPKLGFRDRNAIPSWARGFVARAVEKGIVSGYSDGKFKPDRPISREEMASMLIRAMGLQNEANTRKNNWLNFNDYRQIQPWARGTVVVAVEKGIIKGYDGNNLGPARKASRAEAVTMIIKMLSIR